MPRKRYVYTNKGQPLPAPIEVELDKPAAPAPSGSPAPVERPPDRSARVGDWSDFKIPGER